MNRKMTSVTSSRVAMARILRPLCVAAVLGGAVSGPPSVRSGEGTGDPSGPWLTLFDGTGLKYWTPRGGATWSLEKGVLLGREGSTRGELLNRWQLPDFEAVVTFRVVGRPRVKILFRVGAAQDGYGVTIPAAPGAASIERIPEGVVAGASGRASPEAGAPGDGWQEARIIARGEDLEFLLDGERVARGKDGTHLGKGSLGFRIEAGESSAGGRDATGASSAKAPGEGPPPRGRIEVRQVRVRPLGVKAHRNVPAEDFYCHVCHANFEEEAISATHRGRDIGCAHCHGASLPHRSDEDNVTPPDRIFRKTEVEGVCLECHERCEPSEKERGKGDLERKACTGCHGSHRVP